MLSDALKDSLIDLYNPEGNERVGFILGTEIHEVTNIHPEPRGNFEVAFEDLQYLDSRDDAVAVWHTQPGKMSQMSYEDYLGLANFPELLHVVIGADGLRVYRVENGAVLKDSIYLRKTA